MRLSLMVYDVSVPVIALSCHMAAKRGLAGVYSYVLPTCAMSRELILLGFICRLLSRSWSCAITLPVARCPFSLSTKPQIFCCTDTKRLLWHSVPPEILTSTMWLGKPLLRIWYRKHARSPAQRPLVAEALVGFHVCREAAPGPGRAPQR